MEGARSGSPPLGLAFGVFSGGKDSLPLPCPGGQPRLTDWGPLAGPLHFPAPVGARRAVPRLSHPGTREPRPACTGGGMDPGAAAP